jgi:hypothetical protein
MSVEDSILLARTYKLSEHVQPGDYIDVLDKSTSQWKVAIICKLSPTTLSLNYEG